jgi:hypothetical protein
VLADELLSETRAWIGGRSDAHEEPPKLYTILDGAAYYN